MRGPSRGLLHDCEHRWIVCSSTLLSADQFVPRPAQVCVIAAGGDPGLRRCRLAVTAAEKISELYGVEVRGGMKPGHDINLANSGQTPDSSSPAPHVIQICNIKWWPTFIIIP